MEGFELAERRLRGLGRAINRWMPENKRMDLRQDNHTVLNAGKFNLNGAGGHDGGTATVAAFTARIAVWH